MLSLKPWYFSKTIWASIITIVTSLACLFGFPAGIVNNNELAEAIIQIITAFTGFVAIIGRLQANMKIK
jgi:fumarate reductase subunit D